MVPSARPNRESAQVMLKTCEKFAGSNILFSTDLIQRRAKAKQFMLWGREGQLCRNQHHCSYVTAM